MPSRKLTLNRVLLVLLLPLAAHATDHYEARFSDDLDTVSVRACFDGDAPSELQRHADAHRYTRQLLAAGRRLDEPQAGATLVLPAMPPDSCLEWRLDLREALREGGYRSAFRAGDGVLISTSLWYWSAAGRDARVRVSVPAGMRFSSPWPRVEENIYAPLPGPSWWSSRTAVGPFEQRNIPLPGAQLQLALAGDFSPAQADTMAAFVQRAANAVVPVLGHFPRPSLQVLVVPIGARSEPVPWAHVTRGGGPAVEFFVDADRPLTEFDADWTATHEFSHFLLPYVAYNDRWLSEGLASYFQNVLRARDGRLAEQAAWQRLHDGFERGRRASKDESLIAAARGGRGNTMRVYWAGAALLLQADVALRRQSGDSWSLDAALQAFNGCCVEPGASWRARDLLRKLDQLTGTGVFEELYQQQVLDTRFADLSGLYRELGLQVRGGQVILNDQAPLAGVRRAIMRNTGDASALVEPGQKLPGAGLGGAP